MTALLAIKQFRLRELAPLFKIDPNVSSARPVLRNPFLSFKNPDTGRWAPAKYSLRRQAELIKHARASGTLHLLPPGPKFGVKELEKTSTSITEEAATAGSSSPSVSEEEWNCDVTWEGEIKEKVVPGAEVGNRLYAAKRRMFKGHKWERMKAEREKQQKSLLQSMDKRIERFKQVRCAL